MMTVPVQTDKNVHSRVVVIAASHEGIDALARLINQLPATFPVPMVAHVHGIKSDSIDRLAAKNWRSPSRPNVVQAKVQENICAGTVHVIPADMHMVFTDAGVLGQIAGDVHANANDLFASASRWYQSRVIGVVLSGLGTEGTLGLKCITETNGIRVVQSPYEAKFPSMPANALVGDDVQYTVMLDQMGDFLQKLVAQSTFVDIESAHVQVKTDDPAITNRYVFFNRLSETSSRF